MGEQYFTQQELESGPLYLQERMNRQEAEIARRELLTEEELEAEDRVRLASSSLKYPPVFSVKVFVECYESLVRSMIQNKFRVSNPHVQEDCFQDVCTRLVEKNHLIRYKDMVFKRMDAVRPVQKPNERPEAYQVRLSRWETMVAPYAGKIKVSYPTFQTHIYTVTQTCCVNRGVRNKRDPSTSAVSLAQRYDSDDSRSNTLLQCILDPKSKDHVNIVAHKELLSEFSQYLVSKYMNRVDDNGDRTDHWGPPLPMLRIKQHTENTPAIAVQNQVPMVYGENGRLTPKMDGIHSKELTPVTFQDNYPMVYGEKGKLIPKVVGMPILDEKGEHVYEETGDIIYRSLSQVFKLLKEGYKQSEIAKILQVTAGSPGNWVSRIRQDWVEFLSTKNIPNQLEEILK